MPTATWCRFSWTLQFRRKRRLTSLRERESRHGTSNSKPHDRTDQPTVDELQYGIRQRGLHLRQIFPPLYAPRRIGKIYIEDKKNTFQQELLTPLDDRDPLPQTGVEWSTIDYSVDRYGLKDVSPYLTEMDQDEVLDIRGILARSLAEKLMLQREIDAATIMQTDATFTAAHRVTPSNKWDTASGDPFEDINTARELVWKATGKRPNAIAMSYETWLSGFENNSKVLDRVRNNMIVPITTDVVQTLLPEIEMIFVGTAIKDTSKAPSSSSLRSLGQARVGDVRQQKQHEPGGYALAHHLRTHDAT